MSLTSCHTHHVGGAMVSHTHHTHLAGLVLDVPQRRLQAALRKKAVLQTLQEQEERRLVGEEEGRVSDAVIANQNQLS